MWPDQAALPSAAPSRLLQLHDTKAKAKPWPWLQPKARLHDYPELPRRYALRHLLGLPTDMIPRTRWGSLEQLTQQALDAGIKWVPG